ncbi:MAG: prevent-host-death protein [Alcaligenaceae bacterium]|nr:prevent-host-death protein [Alcaligenaceae bacterium]
MKTATFPPPRVDPQLRRDTESVLREGESLSQFIEQAVRSEVDLHKANEEFLARQTGRYVDADTVLGKLRAKCLGRAERYGARLARSHACGTAPHRRPAQREVGPA